MQSCIYHGQVSHRRFTPRRNRFRYRISMLYLDVERIGETLRPFWLWSDHRAAPGRFERRDHFRPDAPALAEAIRELVAAELGFRPAGKIFLLTNLRLFGYCFNPISIYYCHDQAGDLCATVLEVSNTPWRERHCYVARAGQAGINGRRDHRFEKRFHVSPFLPMDMQYRLKFATPGERLLVSLENHNEEGKVFDAHLNMQRREITHASMAAILARDPLAGLRVAGLIHWQAVKLWLKRVPFFAHPERAALRR